LYNTGTKKFRVVLAIAVLMTALSASAASVQAHGDPTCQGVFGSELEVHGQHVIGDYVTGVGGIDGTLPWPPSHGVVGAVVQANGGVALAGGPGPGFHFVAGFAPGASFCNENAHPNGFEAPSHFQP
jgi:hypothetical protein